VLYKIAGEKSPSADKKDCQAVIHVWEKILKLAPKYPQTEHLRLNIAKNKKGAKKEAR